MTDYGKGTSLVVVMGAWVGDTWVCDQETEVAGAETHGDSRRNSAMSGVNLLRNNMKFEFGAHQINAVKVSVETGSF